MTEKVIEILLCELKTLQKDVRAITNEMVNIRVEHQRLRSEIGFIREHFTPKTKQGFKFYTVIVTTVGGAVAGLIAVINNMVMHK